MENFPSQELLPSLRGYGRASASAPGPCELGMVGLCHLGPEQADTDSDRQDLGMVSWSSPSRFARPLCGRPVFCPAQSISEVCAADVLTGDDEQQKAPCGRSVLNVPETALLSAANSNGVTRAEVAAPPCGWPDPAHLASRLPRPRCAFSNVNGINPT